MQLPIRRIYDEKRRIIIPVLAGLLLNIILYVAVVYPLSVRVRSTEASRTDCRTGIASRRARRSGCAASG